MICQPDQLTIGELIEKLECRDPEETVRFGFGCFVPGQVSSYRGFYEDLALGYNDGAAPTVQNLIIELTQAIGRTFTGYKGGSYRASTSSTLWIANQSEATGTYVSGIELCSYGTVLQTRWVST